MPEESASTEALASTQDSAEHWAKHAAEAEESFWASFNRADRSSSC
jgi:hypothetical protein